MRPGARTAGRHPGAAQPHLTPIRLTRRAAWLGRRGVARNNVPPGHPEHVAAHHSVVAAGRRIVPRERIVKGRVFALESLTIRPRGTCSIDVATTTEPRAQFPELSRGNRRMRPSNKRKETCVMAESRLQGAIDEVVSSPQTEAAKGDQPGRVLQAVAADQRRPRTAREAVSESKARRRAANRNRRSRLQRLALRPERRSLLRPSLLSGGDVDDRVVRHYRSSRTRSGRELRRRRGGAGGGSAARGALVRAGVGVRARARCTPRCAAGASRPHAAWRGGNVRPDRPHHRDDAREG